MNFNQLRSLRAISEQARQHGAGDHAPVLTADSRQVRSLERELGLKLCLRDGKRLAALNAPGRGLLRIAERILRAADELHAVGAVYASQTSGPLTVASTNTQTRYLLPHVVDGFRAAFPDVRIALRQGTPQQIADWLLAGDVDIGIAGDILAQQPGLAAFPCYHWQHVVVVPAAHPLAQRDSLTLADLAGANLITYAPGFAGRAQIDAAFAQAGLQPHIAVTAMDSDVIKEYVSLGLGLGIMAAMAFDARHDTHLRAYDASHLFGTVTAWLALRKGALLRSYAYDFIARSAPQLSRAAIDTLLMGDHF